MELIELTTAPAYISTYVTSTDSPTAETPAEFKLSDYLLKKYIIIIIPSVLLVMFLIIFFTILIKKIINRNKFNLKQLETYSSVNYDDESLDEELGIHDDIMYTSTSCRLLVGEDFEVNDDLTNSEPEYDCMSVDVTVNQSSTVDWRNKENSPEVSPELSHSLKALPHNFWKR